MASGVMDKSPDAFRTISEVADDLDVPQHVLRFWETRFTQIKPMKRSGGRRYYRPEDVTLLRGIRQRKSSKAKKPAAENRRSLKRAQSFCAFVDATATLAEDDYDEFDETMRETMGVVLDIRRNIEYTEIEGEYSHVGYAVRLSSYPFCSTRY